jgi:glutamate/tyrosine decarboxylase-like PLP-dependent enzyme
MNPYLKRIRELEPLARQLEPDAPRRSRWNEAVTGYAARFLDDIYDNPVFRPDHDGGRGLYDSPISEAPIDMNAALELIRENVDEPSLNPASGGHLAYIPGGGVFPSSLGDYLAAVGNSYAGVYFPGPGAVRMEHMLVNWMAELAGLPATAGGDLTSGGSIANLAGIVTARDAHDLRARDFHRTVVYLTEQVHHCINKAIRIAGLGECVVRRIPVDVRSRMRADTLADAIRKDRGDGLVPWLVIASAGTTDTGAVDPLRDIADIASQHGLWYHIDAAYGGFFLLCDPAVLTPADDGDATAEPTERGDGRNNDAPAPGHTAATSRYGILDGIERADSIVMDPHKGLFLPYGTGAVIVRDRKLLQKAHWYTANYMQDAVEAADEYSPADHSPELTRHFRGLRMWLPLKLFGVSPFRAALEEKLMLARYFHEEIQKRDGFEVGPFPELSVVTYRYVPKRGDANEFNRRLVVAVQNDGRAFISSTTLNGVFTLRLAVLCFRSHLDQIDAALDALVRKARELEANC